MTNYQKKFITSKRDLDRLSKPIKFIPCWGPITKFVNGVEVKNVDELATFKLAF